MGFGSLFPFNTQCLKSVQKAAIICSGSAIAIADLLTRTSALSLKLDAPTSILATATYIQLH